MYTGDICPVCRRGAARHDDPYETGMACRYCFGHIEDLIKTKWGGIPQEWQQYYQSLPNKPDFKPSREDLYVIARYRAEVVYEIAEARQTLSGNQLTEQEKLIKEKAKEKEACKIRETCERVDQIRAEIQKKIDREEEIRRIELELRNSSE